MIDIGAASSSRLQINFDLGCILLLERYPAAVEAGSLYFQHTWPRNLSLAVYYQMLKGLLLQGLYFVIEQQRSNHLDFYFLLGFCPRHANFVHEVCNPVHITEERAILFVG